MLPTKERAEAELRAAEALNPGAWAEHSRYAARACENIAARCPGLDAGTAYILGLLHDIGRRAGRCRDHHMPEGYRYCMAQGWEKPAVICITHGFALQRIDSALSADDFTPEDSALVDRVLKTVAYDDYDRLVQLCDALALPTGFCLLETRFVDVALRYGTPPILAERWKKTLAIKADFEKKMGCCLYDVLPGAEKHHL